MYKSSLIRQLSLLLLLYHYHYQTLAVAAASSATAGSHVTTSSFVTGALRELSVALVRGNEVVYREALLVYATASVGATVLTVDPE
jgi:hypothetical protein